MEENNILRLYIMPEVWETVTQSQVFNWIELINGNGIKTDCLSITPEKLPKDRVTAIEKSIQGTFFQIPSRLMLVEDFFLTIFLLKYYYKNKSKYKKIIFQTRLSSIGISFFMVRMFTKAKLIFESRAAANEESNLRNRNKKVTLKTKIIQGLSELSEKLMIKKPQKVFCVSNALKDYYLKKHHVNGNKFTVFPGAADASLFYLDSAIRKKVRASLAFKETDLVVIYSGRLAKKWEIPDKILSFFKSLKTKNKHAKLLLLTPDDDLAAEMVQDFQIQDETKIVKASLEEVNQYLNASDVGLLLREDIPMNNVASPTKFAEYLMTGLPTIISHGVYDFAKNIEETGFGVVVSSLEYISDIEFQKLEKSLVLNKNNIALWGKEHLSKEIFIKETLTELKSI